MLPGGLFQVRLAREGMLPGGFFQIGLAREGMLPGGTTALIGSRVGYGPVRAQWAARPFAWHIYPQEDRAHWPKLEAFLGRYNAGVPDGMARTISNTWHAWNGAHAIATHWPAFRNAMKRRRCLFPADGFYEWKEVNGRKRAYFIRPKSGGPIAFAGLWETWTGPNGEEQDTAAIVMTTANQTCAAIHDRMPAIIAPEAFDMWLDCANVDAKIAEALITPAPEGLLEAYEVSTAVNRVANDSPALLEPAAGTPDAPVEKPKPAPKPKRRKDGAQGSLF